MAFACDLEAIGGLILSEEGGLVKEIMLENLIYGPMLGGRDSEVILGSLVVPGFIFEFAMLAWLGLILWGQVQLTCPLTHLLVSRGGAILALKWCCSWHSVLMDAVTEQSCGCLGTRVVCSIRGAVAVAGGCSLTSDAGICRALWRGVSLLSLKFGACFLQSVRCDGNSCLSWATVAVKHKLFLCSWGTLGLSGRKKICPPIHTPDAYPIHTPIHTRLLPFAAKSLLRSGQY